MLAAYGTLSGVLRKAKFWEFFKTKNLNERQILLLNKVLDGFEDKLTTAKWAKIAKCSQDTALRDVNDLIEQGVLEKEAGGSRSSGYRLVGLDIL